MLSLSFSWLLSREWWASYRFRSVFDGIFSLAVLKCVSIKCIFIEV